MLCASFYVTFFVFKCLNVFLVSFICMSQKRFIPEFKHAEKGRFRARRYPIQLGEV